MYNDAPNVEKRIWQKRQGRMPLRSVSYVVSGNFVQLSLAIAINAEKHLHYAAATQVETGSIQLFKNP